MRPIKRIICPVADKASFTALEEATRLALEHSAELYLVNVVDPVISYAHLGSGYYDLYVKRLISSSRKRLQKIIEQRIPTKVRVHSLIRHGDPADEIVKIATKKRADIIVIATHGRQGLSHLILGSVAEKVARLATCPVLILRPSRKKMPDGHDKSTHQGKNKILQEANV